MDKNECEDKYSESETEEHLNGKRDLYEWIKNQDGVTNAVLEGWISDTKQRPDIMFDYKGLSCVIEFQCSPISSEYLERHDLYNAAGIKAIWILGEEKYLKSNMREKYIQNYAYGFYSYKMKELIPVKDKLLYSRLKSERHYYKHNKESFWGMPLMDFNFDGNIYHRMFGSLDVAKEKIRLRRVNKPIQNRESNIYLNKLISKVRANLENNLNRLTNRNWHFYLRKKTIHIEPNFEGYCHYVIWNTLRKSHFTVIRIKELSFDEYKLCSRDPEFLKTLLLPVMRNNKKALLQYEDSKLRFMEVQDN